MIDIGWVELHYAQIDLSAIKEAYDKWYPSEGPEEALDHAIRDEVAGLDDSEYYAWNDDATEQVRQAFMREYGIQTTMFEGE